MTRSDRFKTIVSLAAGREREAAKTLAECREVLNHQETQLDELTRYRDEYRAKCAAGGEAQGLNQVRSLRVFLERLDQGIRQLIEQISSTRQRVNESESHWRNARVEVKALEKMVDRIEEQEVAKEERRQQRDTDERNLRRKPETR